MKKAAGVASIVFVAVIALRGIDAVAGGAPLIAGAADFAAKCASCHPDGGNIMKPEATLKGIKSSKKIITQVRKGGGGMPAFDAKAISDADAKKLADYIIKTFKK